MGVVKVEVGNKKINQKGERKGILESDQVVKDEIRISRNVLLVDKINEPEVDLIYPLYIANTDIEKSYRDS